MLKLVVSIPTFVLYIRPLKFLFKPELSKRLENVHHSEQIERIEKLFLRLLRLPHADHGATFSMYRDFLRAHITSSESDYDERIWSIKKNGHDKAVAKWIDLEPFELQLKQSGYLWEGYLLYFGQLASVTASWKDTKAPVQYMIATFERAFCHHPTNVDLWNHYLQYLVSYISVSLLYLYNLLIIIFL
jgi:hypothetical protein